MENTSKMKNPVDLSQMHREIYFLVAKFLSGGPLTNTAQSLIKEIEENELVPDRVNWLGESVKQDFKQFSAGLAHVQPDHLKILLEQYLQHRKNSEAGSRSLLSRQLLRACSKQSLDRPPPLSALLTRKNGQEAIRKWGNGNPINAVHSLMAREIRVGPVGRERITTNFYSDRIKLSCRSVGHLTAVYCVLYDNTGKYIFTGADDKLVKVWSAVDGRLLATLRGAQGEITDMAINLENTLLAVGSNDKLIRVWSLRNCESVAVLNEHQGHVTSVFFCPMPNSRSPIRYLASTGTDGSCAFWAYTELPGEEAVFQSKPTLYQERMRPGHAQILCASFSSGGVFMAAGSADNNVRVYYMLCPEGPTRILEVECHKDKVDSISWSHKGVRFISGSKDGTALIYRFECQQWRYTRIQCCKNPPGEGPVVIDDPKKRPRVTMVAWNQDDTLALTATSDFIVKAWNSLNGNLVCILKGHTDEVYVIESHPFNPRIMCTAGHDGLIAMWNVSPVDRKDKDSYYAVKIFEYRNRIEGLGHGGIFDCKLSPDGLGLVATDAYGHLLIFGTENGPQSKFTKLPNELFFHTDYRPFISAATTADVIDEQTNVPIHLMPPPFLVNADGNPHAPAYQRLVPGRERCHSDQLVPLVMLNPGGNREVIEGLPPLPVAPIPIPIPIAQPAPPRNNLLDQRIAELAALNARGENNGEADADANAAPVPPPEPSPGGSRPQQQARDLNNVQQSTATWQPGQFIGQQKKVIVPPLPPGVIRSLEVQKLVDGDEEEEHYRLHLKKSPSGGLLQPNPISPSFSPSGRLIRNRRPRRIEPAYFHQVDHDDRNILDEGEGVARPNPPQQEISVSQESSRRVVVRTHQNSQVNNNNQPRGQAGPARQRQQRRIRYNVRRLLDEHGRESDPDNVDNIPSSTESDSDSVQDMSASSSSDSSEESDSDWNTGTRERDASAKKAKRARRHPSSSPNRSSSKTRKSKRKKTNAINSDTDEEESEPKPGPSSSAAAKAEVKVEPGTKAKPKKKRVVADVGGLDEVPEQYRPPEWLSEVMPKRSPYFPQLGDDLVYFRQGHELYIKQVQQQKIYEVDKKMLKSLPYVLDPDLPAEVSVRLVNVKFEIQPPRLVVLKLERREWETGDSIDKYFYVRYHDMPSVADFLVLRQIYEKSVRHRWNEGDRFRCMMDKTWWLGTVKAQAAFHLQYPDSNFMSYLITWDSDEHGDKEDDSQEEQLSPWDMEIITDDFVIPPDTNLSAGIPASDEDLRNGLYEVRPEDWEPHGHQDAECKRISDLMTTIMNLAIAEPFLTPVDLNSYPEYAIQIEYLIDLSTIKARLDNLFYRRSQAILTDTEHIAINAEKFNQPQADIVKHAKIVSNLINEIVHDSDSTDRSVHASYHRLLEEFRNSGTSGVPPKKTLKVRKPVIRSPDEPSPSDGSVPGPSSEDSNKSGPNRLRKRVPKVRGGGRASLDVEESARPWQARCKELLQIIWNHSDSVHFRFPVDLNAYPDYITTIDTPMCLQSIREDLDGANYETPQQFNKDMMLIFENSRNYNSDPRSQIRLMTVRLQSFYDEKIRRLISDYDHKRKRNKARPTLRTPVKSLRSSRALRTRTGFGNSPRFASSSPRKNGMSSRLSSSVSTATRNGTASPLKRTQRLAAAKNPFIRTKSTDTLPSPPRNSVHRASSSRTQPSARARKVSQNGHSASSRNSRTSSSVSGSAGSTSAEHDHLDSVPTSSHNLRKRRRISSGESTENPTPSLTNGRSPLHQTRSSAMNGTSSHSKVVIKEEHDSANEHETRYRLRNKSKSHREESSSPERNTGHNLRVRTKRRVLRELDSDEFDEDEEEKENNILQRNNGEEDHEGGEPEDEEDGGEEEAEEEEDEDHAAGENEDEDDVEMPALKPEGDDEEYEVRTSEDEFEESEGDPTPSTNLRRSKRAPVKRKLFSEDDASDASGGKPAGKSFASRKRSMTTRHRGKASHNYAETSGDEDD